MTRPMPHPAPVSEPFWAAARRHELVVQRCVACERLAFYPRSGCPWCGAAELTWWPVSGRGTLHTFTVARRATHPKLADRVPYVIAIVELDEGPRLTSTVVDVDPDTLRIGQRLVVGFEDHEEFTLPVFRCARERPPQPGERQDARRRSTMSTTEKSMTREERIELQRQVTAAHIQGENDGEYEGVRQTFVQDERSYFDCVPGGIRFDGTSGIQGWYDILGALLPDLKIEVTHEYDTVGCCLREMTATGTHSLEFAGVQPTGKRLRWEAIALYIFDEQEPGKLIGERAYWDNDALIKQMKGEESPPLIGLMDNPRILEHNSVKSVHRQG